jgi:ubiquinone/menaquinone biosynthesis C-methylase UbiE
MIDHHEKRNLEFFNKNIHPRSANHPVIEFLFDHRLRFFKKFLKEESNIIALELGCGDGISSFHLKDLFKIYGIDFALEPLKINQWVTKINGNAKQLPFSDTTFDVVITSDLLHHTSDPLSVIREMKRVSKKYLLFMEPNPWNPIMSLYCLLHPEEKNVFKLSRKSLISFLIKEKLTILGNCFCGLMTLQRFPLSLFPIMKFISQRTSIEKYIGFEYLVASQKNSN